MRTWHRLPVLLRSLRDRDPARARRGGRRDQTHTAGERQLGRGPGKRRQRHPARPRSRPTAATWRSTPTPATWCPATRNGFADVFVRDRKLHKTVRVSVGSAGVQGNGASYGPSISADGRYVAFVSAASNLVAGDTNGYADVFVRDRKLHKTYLVSVGSAGVQGNERQLPARRSPPTAATWRSTPMPATWWPATRTASEDVFVRDRKLHKTIRVSVGSAGVQGNGDSYDALDLRRRPLRGVRLRCQQPGARRQQRLRRRLRARPQAAQDRPGERRLGRGPGKQRQLRALDLRRRPLRGVRLRCQQPGVRRQPTDSRTSSCATASCTRPSG